MEMGIFRSLPDLVSQVCLRSFYESLISFGDYRKDFQL